MLKVPMQSARLVLVPLLFASGLARAESVIYSSVPNPLPPNVVSQPYEAQSVSEFGNLINFAPGTDRNLTGVRVVLSNWASQANYQGFGDSTGFNVPLTFNIYNVGASNSVGSLITSQTISAFVAWRPPTTANCAASNDDAYSIGGSGTCYHGLAQIVNFSFNQNGLPDSVIYGLAFNTQNYGATPTGIHGPYDSLNFGYSDQSPSVGTDIPTIAYANYQNGQFYTDQGAGGTGTFRMDTLYTDSGNPIRAAVEFTAVPEPGTIFLMGLGLAFVLFNARKRLIA